MLYSFLAMRGTQYIYDMDHQIDTCLRDTISPVDFLNFFN